MEIINQDDASLYLQYKTFKKLEELLDNLEKLPKWAEEKGFDNLDVLKKEYKERYTFEFEIINKMGFCGYFLIVADIINYCKKVKIPVGPARGSAAGSLIAYLAGITKIDPIKYTLLFERFLSIDRISMPDIDTDFGRERRDEVKEYISKKYGFDRVSSICNFGQMKIRVCIKDIIRSLNLGGTRTESFILADKISKTLEEEDENISYMAALENENFRKEMEKNPTVAKYCQIFEGLIRQTGVHAAGTLILPYSLIDNVPLMINKDLLVTAYDGKSLEKKGYLKLDILGLNNLDIIDTCKKLIKQTKGKLERQTSEQVRKTYELLASGRTLGVFQCENEVTQSILKRAKVKSIEEISDILSLIRPGPRKAGSTEVYVNRKNGIEKIHYNYPYFNPKLQETIISLANLASDGLFDFLRENIEHLSEVKKIVEKDVLPEDIYLSLWFSDLNTNDGLIPIAKLTRLLTIDYLKLAFEELLEKIENGERIEEKDLIHDLSCIDKICRGSQGFPLFQEHLMQIDVRCANATKGESDTLRKVVGKKDVKGIENVGKDFIKGLIKGGAELNEDGLKNSTSYYLWLKFILPYGSYGFNLSHSISYSHITYETAFLKANYPLEFYTASLIHETDQDFCNKIIDDAKALSINFAPPNVNTSSEKYSILDDNTIAYSLTHMKGIGEAAVLNLMKNRPYKSMIDFMMRSEVNSGVAKVLIKGGAFEKAFEEKVSRKSYHDNYDFCKKELQKCVDDKKNALYSEHKGLKKKKVLKKDFEELCETDLNFKEIWIKEENKIKDTFKYDWNQNIEDWNLESILDFEEEIFGMVVSHSRMDIYKKQEQSFYRACEQNNVKFLKFNEDLDSKNNNEIFYCICRLDRLEGKHAYKKDKNSFVRRYICEDRYGKKEFTLFDKPYQHIAKNQINPFTFIENDSSLKSFFILKCKINEYQGKKGLLIERVEKWLNEQSLIELIEKRRREELDSIKSLNQK